MYTNDADIEMAELTERADELAQLGVTNPCSSAVHDARESVGSIMCDTGRRTYFMAYCDLGSCKREAESEREMCDEERAWREESGR